MIARLIACLLWVRPGGGVQSKLDTMPEDEPPHKKTLEGKESSDGWLKKQEKENEVVKMDIGVGIFQPANIPQTQVLVPRRNTERPVMMDTTDDQYRPKPSVTNFVPRYIFSGGQPLPPVPASIPASVFLNPKKPPASKPARGAAPPPIDSKPISSIQNTGLTKDGRFDLRTKKGRELFRMSTTKSPEQADNNPPAPEMSLTVVAKPKQRKIIYEEDSDDERFRLQSILAGKKGKRKAPEGNMELVLYEPPEGINNNNNVVVVYKPPGDNSREDAENVKRMKKDE